MAKRAIVFNPAKGERSELEAALGLDGEGSDLTWYETGEDDGGVAAVAQALSDGAELVFAAGGDGTVRVVAEGLPAKTPTWLSFRRAPATCSPAILRCL